tara:strand:+ start:1539 stop:2618 length:1080 start_codon:yes stop_codon:yes gene_type:complete
MRNLKKFLINKDRKIKDALKLIDKNGEKTCLVYDKNKKLFGSLTDGDIRRKILRKGKSINEKIYKFCNRKTIFIKEGKINKRKIKKIFLSKKIEILPLINRNERITKIILKSDIFKRVQRKKFNKSILSKIKVVVMAGGKGQRLDPITRIFPKPLVPIKDKTAIENIIDSFSKFGVRKFFFVVNYKADLIKAYFKNKSFMGKKIVYINESKPLGTAGGLEKLRGKIKGNFVVTNCDVIFDFNFNELIKTHINKKNDLTLVTSNQTSILPYGVCKINSENELIKIHEKPKYKHLITTGLYILNSSILKLIPKNKLLDMNQLIEISKINKKKIGIFKIKQKNWQDIGQLQEYKKKVNLLSV